MPLIARLKISLIQKLNGKMEVSAFFQHANPVGVNYLPSSTPGLANVIKRASNSQQCRRFVIREMKKTVATCDGEEDQGRVTRLGKIGEKFQAKVAQFFDNFSGYFESHGLSFSINYGN